MISAILNFLSNEIFVDNRQSIHNQVYFGIAIWNAVAIFVSKMRILRLS